MATARPARFRHGNWGLFGWCGLITLLVLAPLVRPGFVLSYDMVAVPDQRLVPSALGMGSGLPRAVPLDAVVALLDNVVPGVVLQRLALAGLLLAASAGAAMAIPRATMPVRAVAASAYAWNAYVFERLVIGHWAVLVAYAALPWILRFGMDVRRGRPVALAHALIATAVASLTPTGGVLASALLAGLLLAPGGRHGVRTRVTGAAAAVALQLPWLVPSVLHPGGSVSDPDGVAVFAARSDSPLGLAGSLATLGGIWNADVVPESRALISASALSITVVVLAFFGLADVRRTFGRAAAVVLGSLALAGFGIALGGAVPVGSSLLAWLVEHVPGAGLLRDGQKFLAWYALPLAMCAALGAARLAHRLRRRGNARAGIAVVVVAAALPLLALPDLVWGAAGRLAPSTYPAGWHDVREAVDGLQASGDLIVLPYQPFRAFNWAGGRTVLDPAPRFVGVETVLPDDLTVGTVTVSGEDDRAAAVSEALYRGDAVSSLAGLGVGWVAVERDTPGVVPTDLLRQLEPVTVTATLDLFRVPASTTPWTAVPPRTPVYVGHIVALGVLACCVGRVAWHRSRALKISR